MISYLLLTNNLSGHSCRLINDIDLVLLPKVWGAFYIHTA